MKNLIELAYEKRELMVFQFVVPQMRMRSSLSGLQTCAFAWSSLKVSIRCLRTAKALTSLRLCADLPEPWLIAYVISTLFSYAGPIIFIQVQIDYHVSVPLNISLVVVVMVFSNRMVKCFCVIFLGTLSAINDVFVSGSNIYVLDCTWNELSSRHTHIKAYGIIM